MEPQASLLKNNENISFNFALLFILTCCKKDKSEPSIFWGEYSALYNVARWEGSPNIDFLYQNDSSISFQFIRFNASGFKREDLIFEISQSGQVSIML